MPFIENLNGTDLSTDDVEIGKETEVIAPFKGEKRQKGRHQGGSSLPPIEATPDQHFPNPSDQMIQYTGKLLYKNESVPW